MKKVSHKNLGVSSKFSPKWGPIRRMAIEAAEDLGHKLGEFKLHKKGWAPDRFKMASCETCYGCCWIAHSPTRGYTMGGRLLKYQCGTPEAGFVAEGAEHEGVL